MAWDTAASIINDAAVELGLISADIAAPYSSANRNIIQLCRLLKGVGQDLVKLRAWTHLQKEHTFLFVSGTADYNMLADFARWIDETAWNRSNRLPLGGPVNAKDWQLLKAVTASGVLYNIFRTVAGVIRVYPTPTTTDSVAFEYISNRWVEPVAVKASLDLATTGDASLNTVIRASTAGVAGNLITVSLTGDLVAGTVSIDVSGTTAVAIRYFAGTATIADLESAIGSLAGADDIIEVATAGTPATVLGAGAAFAATLLTGGLHTSGVADAEAPTIGTDTLHFDRRLLVAGAKLYFLRQKGFDTTVAEQEWGRQLSLAGGADGAVRAIKVTPRGRPGFLGSGNLPETGYGS